MMSPTKFTVSGPVGGARLHLDLAGVAGREAVGVGHRQRDGVGMVRVHQELVRRIRRLAGGAVAEVPAVGERAALGVEGLAVELDVDLEEVVAPPCAKPSMV